MNVKERFLKYVSFPTSSDEFSESVPSTEKQRLLGTFLADELKALGEEIGVVITCQKVEIFDKMHRS